MFFFVLNTSLVHVTSAKLLSSNLVATSEMLDTSASHDSSSLALLADAEETLALEEDAADEVGAGRVASLVDH